MRAHRAANFCSGFWHQPTVAPQQTHGRCPPGPSTEPPHRQLAFRATVLRDGWNLQKSERLSGVISSIDRTPHFRLSPGSRAAEP